MLGAKHLSENEEDALPSGERLLVKFYENGA